MPTIDDSSSYVKEADANAYFSSRLYATAWTEAHVEDQKKALIMATRFLDQSFSWRGEPAKATQALAFPRTGIKGVAPDRVPTAIQTAQLELALLLLKTDLTALPETAGFTSIQVDSIRLEVNPLDRNKLIPDGIAALVAPYGTLHGELRPSFDVTR